MTPRATTIPIDRPGAAMRAVWRALVASLVLGAAWLHFHAFDWSLMRRTDSASSFAMAAVLTILLVPTMLLVGSAFRWLLLAAWPARVGAVWTNDAVMLRFGPFGGARLDRARMRIEGVIPGLPARVADEFLPRLMHPEFAGNVVETVMRFTRVTPSELRSILTLHGWITDDDDEE